jgi:hypothetical protein
MAYVVDGIGGVIKDQTGPLTGVSCLAEGADQLFAQQIVDAGGALIGVVPCAGYEATMDTPEGLAAYQGYLSDAAGLVRLDFAQPTEEAFWEAGKSVVDRSDVLVAVWDGAGARGLGGTADVVEYAREQGKEVVVIWPEGVTRA